jgi:hypothetical protein
MLETARAGLGQLLTETALEETTRAHIRYLAGDIDTALASPADLPEGALAVGQDPGMLDQAMDSVRAHVRANRENQIALTERSVSLGERLTQLRDSMREGERTLLSSSLVTLNTERARELIPGLHRIFPDDGEAELAEALGPAAPSGVGDGTNTARPLEPTAQLFDQATTLTNGHSDDPRQVQPGPPFPDAGTVDKTLGL